MIGFLKGRPVYHEDGVIVLDVGGVGYELQVTPEVLSHAEQGQEISVWVYTQVREDAIQLFGFPTMREKRMFLELIKVNGVGPKSAMQIVSASGVDQILDLIESGNAKGLAQLPKVGKKTAEQIILTLKGKLVFTDEAQGLKGRGFQARDEIVSALSNLGFRLAEIEKVVDAMPPETSLEEGVREALRAMTN